MKDTFDIAIGYAGSLEKIAFTYVKNTSDAEDVVQDVFYTLCNHKTSFKCEEHIKAWLIRVTINKCKNILKSSWYKYKELITEDLAYLPVSQSEVLYAVLSLDVKYRLPIHLYYYEEYTINEIADILQEKPSTIGTRLSRAKKQLRDMLGGKENEEEI